MATTLVDRYMNRRYAAFRWRYESSIAQKIGLALAFAGITGLMAQIRIPFEPVPITGQTFAVLLAGVLLGRWWGGISQAFYVGIGAAGVPWFAGWTGGWGILKGATAGYLLGFVLAALFLGFFVDRYINSRKFFPMLGLMLFATFALIHIPGLLWLNQFMPGGSFAWPLWWYGSILFLGGDTVKAMAAAALAKGITPKQAYNGEVDAGKTWRIP